MRSALLCALLLAAPLAAQDGAPGVPPVVPVVESAENAPVVPAQPVVPEVPADAGRGLPASPEMQKITVRRLSDVVAVREGPRSAERVLYFFNPTVGLSQGDHLEQGTSGHSEILLAAGGLVTLFSSAHVILEEIAEDGDVLRIPLVTRLEARSGEHPLRLVLPAGTVVDILNTIVRVDLQPGRMIIRNDGGTPVVVTGDMRLEREPAPDAVPGRVELVRGEQIRIVVVAGDLEEAGQVTELWGAVPVRHDADVLLDQEVAGVLRPRVAEGQAPDACRLTVRGVRTIPRAGLVLRNPGHVALPAPPAPPPDQEPPPPPADEGAPPEVPAGGAEP